MRTPVRPRLSIPKPRGGSSTSTRTAQPPVVSSAAPSSYRSSLPWRIFNGVSTALDRRVGWDRLPLPVSLPVLIGLRNELRRHNLHDTEGLPTRSAPTTPPPAPADLSVRTADGSYNDLERPRAGMAGTRFGRNVPLDAVDTDPDATILDPSPREVSRRVLARREFIPATTVNVLVSAWLQFMIKDWFSHGHGDAQRAYRIPLSADDTWAEDPMVVPRTVADPTRPEGDAGPPSYLNHLSHWWDLSSIYGTSLEEAARRRTHQGGKLRVDQSGVIPVPDDPALDFTREPGFWVGMGMLASLFALEHNAICERLADSHPDWDDDQLFERARLINAAVVAKIHTVEWTPAVIAHPTTRLAMRANWWGLAGERLFRRFGRLSTSEVVSGIPGSPTQDYGVPFSLTEEFAAVYRMHPLLPDHYRLKVADTGAVVQECTFDALNGPASRAVFAKHRLPDLFYSFGTAYAGAIVLRNYPEALRSFVRPNDGKVMDIAAVDVLRIREGGVPRYNEFRRLLRLRPIRTFDELTDDAELASELEDLYDGDVDKLDLMVGMFGEKRPQGFAFSDTAFRIFIVMASRRLNSDRFFTRDYDPRVYSEEGMRWIDDATMASVLLRHWPELGSALDAGANAFQPWPATDT